MNCLNSKGSVLVSSLNVQPVAMWKEHVAEACEVWLQVLRYLDFFNFLFRRFI